MEIGALLERRKEMIQGLMRASALLLVLISPANLRAQPAASEDEEAGVVQSAEGSGSVMTDARDEEAVEEEARPRARKPKRAVRAKPSSKSERPDPMKARLAEISQVYKEQISFGGAEFDLWKKFWTKLRDDRGLFEVRLAKQREGFVDSLRSLEAKDHGQSLADFETMQGNTMRSFEERQSFKIKDFIAERQSKLREFGAAQESERARLAQGSESAWVEEKNMLNIEPVAPPLEEDNKKGKKKGKM